MSVRVAVTRAVEPDDPLVDALARRGATPVLHPLVRIDAPPDEAPLRRAIERRSEYELVAFTSRNAVTAIADRLTASAIDVRDAFPRATLAAVGGATAGELRARGFPAPVIADRADAEGLVAALADRVGANTRVLLPVGDRARATLRDGLVERGADVTTVVVYRTRPSGADAANALVVALRAAAIDVVTFTSGSAAQALFEGAGARDASDALRRARVVVIGRTTAGDVERLGVVVRDVAARPTMDALADAAVRAAP